MIILILFLSDKIVMSFSYENQMLWPAYIKIGNLDLKTWHSQIWVDILFLGSISIVHKWLKDGDNKDKDLKAKTYHLALKTMLQRKCPFVINMLLIIYQ